MTATLQASAKRGRGFGPFTKGERVKDLTKLDPGTVLLEYSTQFDAENTVKVTDVFSSRIYVRFVNPRHTAEFWGPVFCIWDFELETIHLWIAER